MPPRNRRPVQGVGAPAVHPEPPPLAGTGGVVRGGRKHRRRRCPSSPPASSSPAWWRRGRGQDRIGQVGPNPKQGRGGGGLQQRVRDAGGGIGRTEQKRRGRAQGRGCPPGRSPGVPLPRGGEGCGGAASSPPASVGEGHDPQRRGEAGEQIHRYGRRRRGRRRLRPASRGISLPLPPVSGRHLAEVAGDGGEGSGRG